MRNQLFAINLILPIFFYLFNFSEFIAFVFIFGIIKLSYDLMETYNPFRFRLLDCLSFIFPIIILSYLYWVYGIGDIAAIIALAFLFVAMNLLGMFRYMIRDRHLGYDKIFLLLQMNNLGYEELTKVYKNSTESELQIYRLNLRDLGMEEFNFELDLIEGIKIIDLSYNPLKSVDFKKLENLNSLEHLAINNELLNELIPKLRYYVGPLRQAPQF